MGIYQRLIPKQSCVLCSEQLDYCVCTQCESSFSTSEHRCLSCATKLNSDLQFCGECLSHSPYFSKTYALYDYAEYCSQLIKQFKFDHQLCVGDYFAHRLFDLYTKIVRESGEYDAIIPLPLSTQRIKDRGYNQTHELLRVIKNKTNATIDTNCAERIKATQALSSLSLEQRKNEIKNAFSVKPVTYKRVLLVDDVMTTGSSMNEISKTMLKNTDIETCDVMVVARA